MLAQARPDEANRGPRWPLLLIAQWPLAVGLAGWLDSEGGGSKSDLAGAVLAASAAVAVLVGGRQGLRSLSIWVAALCLSGAHFLSLRHAPIQVFLIATAITFLAAWNALWKDGAARTAGLALSFATIALALAVLETAGSAMDKASSGYSTVHRGRFLVQDSLLSVKHVPGSTSNFVCTRSTGEPEFDATYRIDLDGTRHVPDRPDAGPRWFICGGSYTFGEGLNDGQTIPAVLQAEHPGVRVYNRGVRGYGTADVYLELRQAVQEPCDLELCVYLMIEDHFRRTGCDDVSTARGIGGTKPRFRLVDGEPEYVGPAFDTLGTLGRLRVNLLRRSWLYDRLFGRSTLRPRDYQLAQSLVRSMERLCDSAPGVPFLLVILPEATRSETGSFLDLEQWMEDLRAAGVPCLDLRERFVEHVRASGQTTADYFFIEGHPRPEYARLIASWIDERISDGELVPSSPR